MSSTVALGDLPHAPRYNYLFCGSTVGPIDACLALAETIAIVGTVASIILNMTWPAVVFGTSSVIVLGSHALYRRYGNLAGYVRLYQEAQESFANTSKSQQELIGRLNVDVEGVRDQNEALKTETGLLRREREALGKTIDQLNATVKGLQQENEGLQSVNKDLGGKVQAMNVLAREMNREVEQFNGQSHQLREVVVEAAGVTKDLGRVAPELGGAVKAFDTTFDEDLADFGGVIGKIRDLFAQLQQQNAEYVAQIAELRQTTESLGKTERDFSEEAGRVEELVRGIRGAADDIRASQLELGRSLDAFKEEDKS